MITTVQFPSTRQSRLLQAGPVGQLEVLTTCPEPPRSLPVVAIICHPHPLFGGNMHNKVVYTLARSFESMGCRTLRFNFRGVGQSDGQYDHGIGETDDVLALVQWLQIVCPNDTIWLAGFSFGAYVAARAAKTGLPSQLICVAPPIERFPFTALWPFPCPCLFIQGDADEIVSPSAAFSWIHSLATNKLQLLTIEGASHFFHGRLVELQEQLIMALSDKTLS